MSSAPRSRARPLWATFIKNRAPIKDGMIEVPKRPGFGLELDWDLVEK